MKLKLPSSNTAPDDTNVGFTLVAVPEENELIASDPNVKEARKHWKRRSTWKYTVEVCRKGYVCALFF